MPTDTANPFAALEAAAQRSADEETAARKLAAARTSFLMGRDARAAFFAVLALRLKPVPTWDQTQCMGTDGRELLYNPARVAALTPEELRACIAHEVMHCALHHFARCEGKDPGKWNQAADYAINPTLRAAGFTLPKSATYPADAGLPEGLSAEEYYVRLPQDDQDKDNQEQPGPGEGAGDGPGEVLPPTDPAEAAETSARWQVATAQAAHAAKMRGDIGPALGRFVSEATTPAADWRAVLREFVSAHARDDYSWARPSRRSAALGVYLPGIRSDALGLVAVLVDTSGSIGAAELARFAGELQDALTVYPCRAVILYHDSEVTHRQEWDPTAGPLVLEARGGGGTDHRPAFAALAQEDEAPALCLCLTDGYTTYPEAAPDFPTLWAMTTTQRAPFGVHVQI